MRDGIDDALRTVGAFLPKLAAFLLIIIATWIVAKVVSGLVSKLAKKANADNLVAKNDYGRQALSKSKGGVGGLLGTVAKVAVWLVGLSLAFRVFGSDNPVTQYVAATVAFIPRIIAAVAIVALALWLASIVRNLLQSVLGGVSYGNTVATFVGAFIAVFGILAALSQLEIAPNIINAIAYAALFAVVGVIVVGVGGGLIKPMSERWQRTLDKVEQDAPKVKESAQARNQQSGQAQYQPYPTESAATPATDDTQVYASRATYGSASASGAQRPAGFETGSESAGYETSQAFEPPQGFSDPQSEQQKRGRFGR